MQIRLLNLNLAYGEKVLLRDASLTLQQGEKVALLGRNGAGKSTLLKIIAGDVAPEDGDVQLPQGLKVAYLPQGLPQASPETVLQHVAGRWPEGRRWWQTISGEPHDEAAAAGTPHAASEEAIWAFEQKARSVLSRLELDPEARMDALSGGWRRRVALAAVLAGDPDYLLLDEPTNHLDIDGIWWLEKHLSSFPGGLLLVSHDRAFMDAVVDKIVMLDRGQLVGFPGNYTQFEVRRLAALEAQERADAQEDKKLAQEEAWLRQGVKARRTRNEGRVRALQELRKARAARLSQQGKVQARVQVGETSGKQVAVLEDAGLQLGGRWLFRGVNFVLQRGDKLALLGPNGSGKTSFIKMLLGELAPSEGTVRLGTRLKIAYFDQLREGIDLDASLMDNVGQGNEMVTVNGQSRHIISYLSDFLFSPQQARGPARHLSGGELNRLLLARLFLQDANVLVLDEPTNDLDVETLEVLEDLLVNYTGTFILVSHDRRFVDETVTSSLVFGSQEQPLEIIGGYEEWQKLRQAERQQAQADRASSARDSRASQKGRNRRPRLSYRERMELASLPEEVEAVEARLKVLQTQVNEPDFFSRQHAATAPVLEEIGELEQQLETLLQRWEALELKRSEAEG